ncbi:hypothetical protein OsJ_20578 [Oryza sativa Japonica Group]|uniref:EF-hand domain-containing protein n=1 Tax=Oryza sativa subsp. japonica TaxID=39947 RepID=A3B9L7_ORYSJ|nr:hypothetical protein OsJ_20578 [Oryza sativa Japonica Group]
MAFRRYRALPQGEARAGVRAADANRDGAVAGDDEVATLFAFAQRHLNVKIAELGASYY